MLSSPRANRQAEELGLAEVRNGEDGRGPLSQGAIHDLGIGPLLQVADDLRNDPMAQVVHGDRQSSPIEQRNGVVGRKEEIGAGRSDERKLDLLGERIAPGATVDKPHIGGAGPGKLLQPGAVAYAYDRNIAQPLDDSGQDAFDVHADSGGIDPAEVDREGEDHNLVLRACRNFPVQKFVSNWANPGYTANSP